MMTLRAPKLLIYKKINIYASSIMTNSHNKEMPKEKTLCNCLSIIMLDSVIKGNKNYYLQTLIEDFKYVQEKIKTDNYIDEDLEKSNSNDETESGMENDY